MFEKSTHLATENTYFLINGSIEVYKGDKVRERSKENTDFNVCVN